MARTEPSSVVSDAGPVIHLDELACLDLLSDFPSIIIPPQVWNEVARHRPNLSAATLQNLAIVGPPVHTHSRLVVLAESLGLDLGERAALSLLMAGHANVFLCDDAAARLAAESLGFVVHGTVGVIIRAIRRGLRSRNQVLELLQDLPQRSTLHVSRGLLTRVIEKVEREAPMD